jgi:hypothetical protein
VTRSGVERIIGSVKYDISSSTKARCPKATNPSCREARGSENLYSNHLLCDFLYSTPKTTLGSGSTMRLVPGGETGETRPLLIFSSWHLNMVPGPLNLQLVYVHSRVEE